MQTILEDTGRKYLKHRSYADNRKGVFSLMKDGYKGLFFTPKHKVQSVHFSGKHFILHCAIVQPVKNSCHYYLSDGTKHDGILVHQVLRDITAKYEIMNEDLWIQSDNVSWQYKNKIHFFYYSAIGQ